MKKSIKDLENIQGKTALVRVDINVPLDENKNVTDDTRIRAILPTLELLKEKGAKYFGIHAFLASNTVTNEYYITKVEIKHV